MKSRTTPRTKSAPACQLSRMGTAETYEVLKSMARTLSDDKLAMLEDEMSFFERTGLIGIQMSRLLAALAQDAEEKAA